LYCNLQQTEAGKESMPLAFLQRGYPTYAQALSGTPKMKS